MANSLKFDRGEEVWFGSKKVLITDISESRHSTYSIRFKDDNTVAEALESQLSYIPVPTEIEMLRAIKKQLES